MFFNIDKEFIISTLLENCFLSFQSVSSVASLYLVKLQSFPCEDALFRRESVKCNCFGNIFCSYIKKDFDVPVVSKFK